MRNRPLNTPHVAPDVLHQIYPYVLWWATDLVATPQQRFPVGSPANVKVRKISAEQAPRVLEASTVLLRDEETADQVMDLASPPMGTGFCIGITRGFTVETPYVRAFSA